MKTMTALKKLISYVMITAILLGAAGCGAGNQQSASSDTTAETIAEDTTQTNTAISSDTVDSQPEESEAQASGNDILVVYFSRTGEQYGVGVIDEGNTAIVAKMIAEETGADLFEIIPADDHYPMTYDELTDVAKQEQNEKARPEYAGMVPDLSQYDTVFIGAPVWWGDWPMIMYTFFENENLSGKTLYPFSTHAGSGLSGFDKKLVSAVPDSTVGKGLAIAGTECQNDQGNVRSQVNEWIADLGLQRSEPEENSANSVGAFDLDKGIVLLNSGYEMPILGIGTYALSDTQAEDSVYWALKAGFRLIDTARIYGNEAGVGRGLQRAIDEGIVTREEVFITTKMWTSDYGNGDAAIDASLKRLGVDYIDLMILHHSQPSNDVEAYQAMERAVEDGKLRSIGLSNYYEPEDFDRLVNATTIKPVLLQNETHPYHQSILMKDHISQYGTVMESWFPLGGRANTQTLFNDETISSIAQVHGVSSAQVIIRWHLQAGNICIPGSSNEQHIIEDYNIWDFELSEEEMAQMTALEKDERFADY